MRNLTITLTTQDGKLQVSESTGWPEGYPPSKPWLAMIMNDLKHRLDMLERNGPCNDVVKNSLQPAPAEGL